MINIIINTKHRLPQRAFRRVLLGPRDSPRRVFARPRIFLAPGVSRSAPFFNPGAFFWGAPSFFVFPAPFFFWKKCPPKFFGAGPPPRGEWVALNGPHFFLQRVWFPLRTPGPFGPPFGVFPRVTLNPLRGSNGKEFGFSWGQSLF